MPLELRTLAEALQAASANVGRLARVQPQVSAQVLLIREPSRANLALERLLSRVDSLVYPKMMSLRKPFRAHGALMGAHIFVRPHVPLQMGSLVEFLGTNRARIRLFSGVCQNVPFEVMRQRKASTALRASMQEIHVAMHYLEMTV